MADKKTQRDFEVQVVSKAQMTKTIRATSLEDALAKALSMKEEEFVTFLADCNDGHFWVSGVYESNPDV